MIETTVFYGVKCDRCHEMYEDSNDFTFFYDKSEALEEAMDADWIEKDGKHYCPSCYEGLEEDDTLKIKPSIPKQVFKLRKLLMEYESNYAGIAEHSDDFTVSCYLRSNTLPDKPIMDMIAFILKGFVWEHKLLKIENCFNCKLIITINK